MDPEVLMRIVLQQPSVQGYRSQSLRHNPRGPKDAIIRHFGSG